MGSSLNKEVACIHLKKITHWKKFSSERNWEQMKKLDSFDKKLSASQVNFSV